MNRFELLKNYKDFANHIRYNTADTLLAQLKETTNPELRKTLMLRIVEEVVASTEDLGMWLLALHKRNDGDKRFRDEWERLLMLEITQQQSLDILLSYRRIKTVKGFLKKMDFPSLNQLATKLSSDEQKIIDAVDAIKKTIKAAIGTRLDKSGRVVRAHNKMKHGMMVYSDLGSDSAWIRDFTVKFGKSKRISRKDISFDIPVDLNKAERIVGTIKANSYAVEASINLLLIDYEYRIKSGKIRMKKAKKEKCLVEIEKALA